ncbi:MAG: hypothetical protein FWC03_04880 [Treponema sp.]|nr:hypothetical protein [Treponema sp.]
MSAKKKVLIITDGTELIESIARSVKSALKCTVKISHAGKLDGTDLLSAETFFIGCEKPNPSSFDYLSDMLKHINFAGRHCGIFSANNKALKYLGGIIKDCEVITGEPLLIAGHDAVSVSNWVNTIINY